MIGHCSAISTSPAPDEQHPAEKGRDLGPVTRADGLGCQTDRAHAQETKDPID